MRVFGLIGFPLVHSFSQKYFSEKFRNENIRDCEYRNFSLKNIREISSVFELPKLCGLNVTIPYKQEIIAYLDELSPQAKAIGAVNTVLVRNGKKIGFNTDSFGFEYSLLRFLAKAKSPQSETIKLKALVLGTGGSSKAVVYVLKKKGIEFQLVSRTKKENSITYSEINPQTILEYKLIINTTPLGMFPKTEETPSIPYSFITSEHFLFDLIYNPAETEFLKRGRLQGAQTKNGMEMLCAQAEKSWEIWNSDIDNSF